MHSLYASLRRHLPLLPVFLIILILSIFTATRLGLALYTGIDSAALSL